MTTDSDLCHVLNTTFTTTVNPATMVLVGFSNLVIPLVAPLAIFLYLKFCMMLLLLFVNMGLSTAIWPIIRGCYWILNIIGGTSRYRRKAMKLSYRWLSYSGSTCLHWSFNRAVNTQWTPMNLDQINVPDDPLSLPRYVRHPALAVGRFVYIETFKNSSVMLFRKDSKIEKQKKTTRACPYVRPVKEIAYIDRSYLSLSWWRR